MHCRVGAFRCYDHLNAQELKGVLGVLFVAISKDPLLLRKTLQQCFHLYEHPPQSHQI